MFLLIKVFKVCKVIKYIPNCARKVWIRIFYDVYINILYYIYIYIYICFIYFLYILYIYIYIYLYLYILLITLKCFIKYCVIFAKLLQKSFKKIWLYLYAWINLWVNLDWQTASKLKHLNEWKKWSFWIKSLIALWLACILVKPVAIMID